MRTLFFFVGLIVILLASIAFAEPLTTNELDVCEKTWKHIELTPEEIELYYNIPKEERDDVIRKLSVGKLLTSKEYEVYKKYWKYIELTPEEQGVFNGFTPEKREIAARKFSQIHIIEPDPRRSSKQTIDSGKTTDYSF